MNNGLVTYSQCGEDIIINFLAQHVLHIDRLIYIDLGSNDPIKFNNTYLLYKSGHRGLCVDPNPLFKPLYKKMREEDTFISCGVGKENGKMTFFEIEPHTLSTFSKETAISYTRDGTHSLVKKHKVPIFTIDKLIDQFFDVKPNLLSIDIEGLDFDILSSIEFKKWRPAIICAETLKYSTSGEGKKIDAIFELLNNAGYRVYADTYINTIFVSNEAWSGHFKGD